MSGGGFGDAGVNVAVRGWVKVDPESRPVGEGGAAAAVDMVILRMGKSIATRRDERVKGYA